ncbi:MAG: acetoacetate decarboxylase family protein [Microthrixaceae bacterium]
MIRYPTHHESVAALLPPGMEPWGEPHVQIGIYCVPVNGEPEHGVSTKVPARWRGTDGWYTLGIGIDQESAIFISQTNSQPKFPCEVRATSASRNASRQAAHTRATPSSPTAERSMESSSGQDVGGDEWWVKVSRAVRGPGRPTTAPVLIATTSRPTW